MPVRFWPGTNGTISAGSNGYALMLVRFEPLVPVRATNRYKRGGGRLTSGRGPAITFSTGSWDEPVLKGFDL